MAFVQDVVRRVRLFYDPTREPLRRRVYSFLLACAALAVAAGILTGSAAATVAGPLAVVLAVPVVESARSKVTPVAAPLLDDDPGKHAAPDAS